MWLELPIATQALTTYCHSGLQKLKGSGLGEKTLHMGNEQGANWVR